MTLWLMSKHDTFQNNFFTLASLEPAVHSCVISAPNQLGDKKLSGLPSCGCDILWFSLPPSGFLQMDKVWKRMLEPMKIVEYIFLHGKWTLIIRIPLPHLADKKAEFHNINHFKKCRQQCLKGIASKITVSNRNSSRIIEY